MSSAAAIWSAVAASFAAISAILTMLIHRRSMLDAARPEVVLLGWERRVEMPGGSATDQLRFRSIKNVGAGAAFYVVVYSHEAPETGPYQPCYGMLSIRLAVLAPGEERELDAGVCLFWRSTNEYEFRDVRINIWCWDRLQKNHTMTYRMHVGKDPERVGP